MDVLVPMILLHRPFREVRGRDTVWRHLVYQGEGTSHPRQSQKRGTAMFNGINGHGDKALNRHFALALVKDWKENPRWQGITRPYTPGNVLRLRGSLQIEYTLA